MERLWRSVKYEDIYITDYERAPELESGLRSYFWFYDEERPHTHSITGPLARSIGPGFTGAERGKASTMQMARVVRLLGSTIDFLSPKRTFQAWCLPSAVSRSGWYCNHPGPAAGAQSCCCSITETWAALSRPRTWWTITQAGKFRILADNNP